MFNVYKIKNLEKHNFSGTVEEPFLSNSDYQLLDEYFINTQSFNLKILIGGLNLLAYGLKNEKNAIINYVKRNSINIANQIDNILPDLYSEYNDIGIQYYNKLLNSNFSYNLIKRLDTYDIPKLSEKNFYGLKYLLLFWSANCYNDFEKWYLSTERRDLLLCFVSSVLDSIIL